MEIPREITEQIMQYFPHKYQDRIHRREDVSNITINVVKNCLSHLDKTRNRDYNYFTMCDIVNCLSKTKVDLVEIIRLVENYMTLYNRGKIYSD